MQEQILDGYVLEAEAARQIRRTTRTLKRWRAKRQGPPFVLAFGRIYYHVPTMRDWLFKQQIDPVHGKPKRVGRRSTAQSETGQQLSATP
jgi:hypothetical protein